jgi:hypothetical protein
MNRLLFARKNYLEAIKILTAQAIDPELESPNIIIEPQEGLIQKSVQKLKQMDPNYFQGVRKIVVTNEAAYGHVESGPGKDPHTIHLNFPKIKQEMTQKLKQMDPNVKTEIMDDAIVTALAETIAHERGHIGPYKSGTPFEKLFGETEAEQKAKEFLDKQK